MELRIWQIKGSSFFFILGRIIVIQLDEKKQQLWTISLWILSHERLYMNNEIIWLSSVSDDHFVFFCSSFTRNLRPLFFKLKAKITNLQTFFCHCIRLHLLNTQGCINPLKKHWLRRLIYYSSAEWNDWLLENQEIISLVWNYHN